MRKYKAQGLIEFAVVIPILLVVLLGIIEFTLYWRDTQTVQQMAYEAGVVAAREVIGPPPSAGPPPPNPGVVKAVALVQKRTVNLGASTTFQAPVLGGTEPYTTYTINSVAHAPSGKPKITIYIDYRNPTQRGVITQIVYRHISLSGGVAFTVPGGRTFKLLPGEIPIISAKVQQYQVY